MEAEASIPAAAFFKNADRDSVAHNSAVTKGGQVG